MSGIGSSSKVCLRRVWHWARTLTTEGESEKIAKWRRALHGNLQIGENTDLSSMSLAAHMPAGCSLSIGDCSDVHAAIVVNGPDVALRIGSRTHVGWNTLLNISEGLVIGDDVLIAWDVLVLDHDAHSVRFAERRYDGVQRQPKQDWDKRALVTIGDKSWIGAKSILLKGVQVGEGAIIGAGSVVTKNVPAWTIVGGNPARVIRSLTEEERT